MKQKDINDLILKGDTRTRIRLYFEEEARYHWEEKPILSYHQLDEIRESIRDSEGSIKEFNKWVNFTSQLRKVHETVQNFLFLIKSKHQTLSGFAILNYTHDSYSDLLGQLQNGLESNKKASGILEKVIAMNSNMIGAKIVKDSEGLPVVDTTTGSKSLKVISDKYLKELKEMILTAYALIEIVKNQGEESGIKIDQFEDFFQRAKSELDKTMEGYTEPGKGKGPSLFNSANINISPDEVEPTPEMIKELTEKYFSDKNYY